jgi:hypothetical protein
MRQIDRQIGDERDGLPLHGAHGGPHGDRPSNPFRDVDPTNDRYQRRGRSGSHHHPRRLAQTSSSADMIAMMIRTMISWVTCVDPLTMMFMP